MSNAPTIQLSASPSSSSFRLFSPGSSSSTDTSGTDNLNKILEKYNKNVGDFKEKIKELKEKIGNIYSTNWSNIKCLNQEYQDKIKKVVKRLLVFNFKEDNIFKSKCKDGFDELTDTNLILYFIAKYDTYLNIIDNFIKTLLIIELSKENNDDNYRIYQERFSLKVLDYLGLIINFFLNNNNLENACKVVETNKKKTKNDWGRLDSSSFEEFRNKIKEESDSTLYMLMCFRKSIFDEDGKSLDDKGSKKIKFIIPGNIEFTNIWQEDKQNIKFVNSDKPSKDFDDFNLLITGFGPSAAGKTFLIKNLLSNLRNYGKKQSREFVSEFTITIDGETFRENSMIFNCVLMLSHLQGLLGFENADKSAATTVDQVKAGTKVYITKPAKNQLIKRIKEKEIPKIKKEKSDKPAIARLSLLNTTDLKSNFKKFLKHNDDDKPNSQIFGGNFNIYLPDTLSSSVFDINKYIFLNSNEKFVIYMLIFQCKNGCKFCKGTSESGERRGLESGKKYSSKSYTKSLDNGIDTLKKGEKGLLRLLIHNSGGETVNLNTEKGTPSLSDNVKNQQPLDSKEKEKYKSIIYRDKKDFLDDNNDSYILINSKDFKDNIDKYNPSTLQKQKEMIRDTASGLYWKLEALGYLKEIEKLSTTSFKNTGKKIVLYEQFINLMIENYDNIDQEAKNAQDAENAKNANNVIINLRGLKLLKDDLDKLKPSDSSAPTNPDYYEKKDRYDTIIDNFRDEATINNKFREFLDPSTTAQGGGYDSRELNNSHIEQNKKNYSVQPEKKNQLHKSSSSVTKKKKYVLSQKYRTKKR